MDLIKKDGRIQEFDMSKIKQSILNSANEIDEPLTNSDLKVIESEIINILKVLNRENTSSYEIFAIIFNALNKLGFSKISKAYLK